MKERIATKIYTSMTGDNPFNEMVDSASNTDKISFKIAKEEIDNILNDEGLPLKEKDLSMVTESESGMKKEDDFTNFNINQSEYADDTELSIVEESLNGMSKEEDLVEEFDEIKSAGVQSLIMDEDDPGFVDTDSKGEAEELMKIRKKRNKELFKKQSSFDDMVDEVDLKLDFPFHSVQVRLDGLYDDYNSLHFKSMPKQLRKTLKEVYKDWKKYMVLIGKEARNNKKYNNAFLKAKKADKTFNMFVNGSSEDWGGLFVTTLARIKRAHEALYY